MLPLKIIFQDDYLMVIDKPPGLVVDRSNTQNTDVLEEILQRDFTNPLERGGIVHRLDKDTSGILLVAKTQAALDNLQAQFKERTVKKQYTCLVHGQVLEAGEIDQPIGRNPSDREKFVVMDQGRPAQTNYQPIGQFSLEEEKLKEIFADYSKIQMRKLDRQSYHLFSLLKCAPLTGRTHQIRVHLKYIGHPIVGDEKYAGRKTARLDKRWCDRQFLHASQITFNHPQSGEELRFDCPLPEDLEKALGMLKKG